MKLITAHRILIGAAITFGAFFSGWQVWNYTRTGEAAALLIAAFTALITGGLAYYLKNLKRFVG